MIDIGDTVRPIENFVSRVTDAIRSRVGQDGLVYAKDGGMIFVRFSDGKELFFFEQELELVSKMIES